MPTSLHISTNIQKIHKNKHPSIYLIHAFLVFILDMIILCKVNSQLQNIDESYWEPYVKKLTLFQFRKKVRSALF